MKKIILGLTTAAAIICSPIVIAEMEATATEGLKFTDVATETQVVKLKTPDGKVINATVNAKDVKNLKKGDKIEFFQLLAE